MKKIIFVFCLLLSFKTFAAILTCVSSDYNPDKYDGQGLQVLTDSQGNVLKISKMTGSWFCDEKSVSSPKKVSQSAGVSIYEVNFECDEWNGRLVLSSNLKKARYEFSWADDEQDRRASYSMVCK